MTDISYINSDSKRDKVFAMQIDAFIKDQNWQYI